MGRVILAALGVFLLSTVAFAQFPDDAFQVHHAANLGSGESVVNLTSGGPTSHDCGECCGDNCGFAKHFALIQAIVDPGDICANIYVLAQDQQLIACCACPLTPNHLKTLSVQNDLINNTLTPGVPTAVTIGLIGTDGGQPCDAAALPGQVVGGLRAWGTTLHAAPGGGFAVSETPFSQAGLSFEELDKLSSYCGFIQANGSKYGICGTCTEGAAGAARR